MCSVIWQHAGFQGNFNHSQVGFEMLIFLFRLLGSRSKQEPWQIHCNKFWYTNSEYIVSAIDRAKRSFITLLKTLAATYCISSCVLVYLIEARPHVWRSCQDVQSRGQQKLQNTSLSTKLFCFFWPAPVPISRITVPKVPWVSEAPQKCVPQGPDCNGKQTGRQSKQERNRKRHQ